MNEAHDTAKEQLRLLAIEYRGFPIELLNEVEPQHCPIILSEFAVCLLDSAIDTPSSDAQRGLLGKVRNLHVQRAKGETVEGNEWELLQDDSLAASKLWPAEWLCSAQFPWSPPIARAAVTIAGAKFRWLRDLGDAPSAGVLRDAQAKLLREILSKYGTFKCRYE